MNHISPYVVRITDEFFQEFELHAEDIAQVLSIVADWLNNSDSTPIYDITIEINQEAT